MSKNSFVERKKSGSARPLSLVDRYRRSTSMSSRRPATAWQPLDLIEMPSAFVFEERPKKVQAEKQKVRLRRNFEQIQSDEAEKLLKSVDIDDCFHIHVNCLSNYRTLIEAIDLRRTPLNQTVLRSLQQRENTIIQQNACRDVRFHSLLEVLQPYGSKLNKSKSSLMNIVDL